MPRRKAPLLKVLANPARPDRVAAESTGLSAFDEVPPPPAWLVDVHAVQEWNRLAGTLVKLKLLHDGNTGLFAQMCALHGHLVGTWIAGGEPPSAASLTTYRRLVSDLGLTRAMTPTPAVVANRFLSNFKRR